MVKGKSNSKMFFNYQFPNWNPNYVWQRGGSYWCYKYKELVDKPDIRFKIQFEIEDGTGKQYITVFEEQNEKPTRQIAHQ
ncbi:hypothetical protein FRX31_016723 [Thalictrum thalictroides]|uniref:Replication factor A C-terminal domain-containing protein n=1 Tax=Thalictrum thalictroides TaxID=46969 RepID=A0A7J6WAQ8_THATH|nr:hypothetical protein FRX31_016723 [Thalictrum thalictroides]